MPTDSQQTVVATDSAQDLILFNSTLTCKKLCVPNFFEILIDMLAVGFHFCVLYS